MADFTPLLDAAARGDRRAAAELLPLVYDELRRLAAARLAHEQPGHTLDATALVHEAYLRLVQGATPPAAEAGARFANQGHFFAAAAEAMRRILVDHARRKHAQKRGGGPRPAALDPDRLPAADADADVWLDLDAALTRFEAVDAAAAALAKLRLFGGLSVEEAGEALGLSRATAFRHWTYARAWLTAALAGPDEEP
jgi:RNA polymerase sigma factor (TIGR02999 family)